MKIRALKRAALVSLVVGASFAPSLARADEPAAPLPAEQGAASSEPAAPVPVASATAQPPRDIVRLKNGGMIRGTILELTPGAPVIIQLPTGEIRKIPWADTTDAGPEKTRAPAVEEPEPPPPPKKHVRSPGLLTAGIVATAASPIALLVTFIGWADQRKCEFDRDAERRFAAYDPHWQTPPPTITYDCNNSAAIVGGIVGAVVLLGAGVPMIVYGAKRIPMEPEKETAVRFVPWNRGTTGAGGSLQIRF